jgi:hypothetical protein
MEAAEPDVTIRVDVQKGRDEGTRAFTDKIGGADEMSQ